MTMARGAPARDGERIVEIGVGSCDGSLWGDSTGEIRPVTLMTDED